MLGDKMCTDNITCNSKWKDMNSPYITVVTPVFNREDTVLRAMESIGRQSFRDFEYIVVNDGSTDGSEKIILDFLSKDIVPMLYIRKKNGGVHTARNMAIKYARGKMYYCNDSDDESLPDALSILVERWKEVEADTEYFELKARCVDENGNEVGPKFPKDINQQPWKKIKKFYNNFNYENVGFRRIDVMRNNPWPEPDEVTFVGENIIWKKLRNIYRTYLINDIVQIYHTEGNDHLDTSLTTNRSLQHCINSYWNSSYVLEHFKEYSLSIMQLYKYALIRDTMFKVIKKQNETNIKFNFNYNKKIIVACVLMNAPASLAARVYVKKYKIDR